MYRNQELPAALARGQLMHLDENNAVRIANAEPPDPGARQAPGRHPPLLPAGVQARVLHVQRPLRPEGGRRELRAARVFRIAVEKALYKEGLLIGQWQTMPVPAQDLFQSKLGYGGSRYPWSINEAKGITYDYDPAQFPVAQALCDTYTVVHGIHRAERPGAHGEDRGGVQEGLGAASTRPWPTPTTRSIPGRTAKLLGTG